MEAPIELAIPVYSDVTPDEFRERLHPLRTPCILRGQNLGPCTDRWKDIEYLKSKCPETQEVRIHVTKYPNMDFRKKNFAYETTSMHKLLDRASSSQEEGVGELCYLRHAGYDPRSGSPANLESDFPDLAPDFCLPELFEPPSRFFSSVLRVSSPKVRVWTHYDVLDNVYAQVVGRKKAVMWAPDEALNMYLEGDKSAVVDIDAEDNANRFPKFCRAQRHVGDLEPGDLLFIPSMWFHNMTAVDFGVAVNVFWRNLDAGVYDGKDAYGNRDLLQGAKGLRMLDNVMRQLDSLPEEIRDFYGRMMIARISKKVLSKPL